MMKPNELRIGNYVIDNRDRICQVTEINSDISEIHYGFMAWPINGQGTTTTPHKPIPLTEQWLLDFGFEKECEDYRKCFFYKDDFEIEIHGDKYVFRVYGGESAPHLTQFFAHHTRNVHQLQNLYFALTGEELTIKEKV